MQRLIQGGVRGALRRMRRLQASLLVHLTHHHHPSPPWALSLVAVSSCSVTHRLTLMSLASSVSSALPQMMVSTPQPSLRVCLLQNLSRSGLFSVSSQGLMAPLRYTQHSHPCSGRGESVEGGTHMVYVVLLVHALWLMHMGGLRWGVGWVDTPMPPQAASVKCHARWYYSSRNGASMPLALTITRASSHPCAPRHSQRDTLLR